METPIGNEAPPSQPGAYPESWQVMEASPSLASGFMFQALAQAVTMAGQNAVAAQQQMNTLTQAVATVCALELLGEPQLDFPHEDEFEDGPEAEATSGHEDADTPAGGDAEQKEHA